eukprot:g3945.t1
MKPFECGTTILTESEQDILLSWSVIIMITLHQLPLLSTGDLSLEDRMEKAATEMKGFVEQVLKLIASGVNLEKLLETQEIANRETYVSPSIRLMQLNSLIVTLTVEIVTQLRTGTNGDSYVASFLSTEKRGRDLSVKCLICFMGGTLGSVFCIDRFITSVMESFTLDLTAKELIKGVSEEEYKQAWNLLSVLDTGVDRTEASITRQLFGRWVSIVFITLAESGLAHALSTSSSGWAWAFEIQSDEDMFEMTNLTQFVQNALRRVISDDTRPPLDLSERLRDVPDMLKHLSVYQREAEEKKVQEYGSSLTAVEDEELGKTSSTAFAFWQMILLVHLTYRKLIVYQEEQQ